MCILSDNNVLDPPSCLPPPSYQAEGLLQDKLRNRVPPDVIYNMYEIFLSRIIMFTPGRPIGFYLLLATTISYYKCKNCE